MCEFVQTSRQTLADLPFLDNRTLGQSPLKELLSFRDVVHHVQSERLSAPDRKCDFLFHTAFCGSTLLARLIDRPSKVLSLKEPYAILGLAGLHRAKRGDFNDWLDLSLDLLSRPFVSGERVIIKPSNGANALAPPLLNHPRTGKILLLYGSLEQFLLAVISGGVTRLEFVDALLKHFNAPAANLPPLIRAALVWAWQLKAFEELSQKSNGDRVASLHSETLLRAPHETLQAVNGFFGFGLTEQDIEETVGGSLLSRNAKNLSQFFDADRVEAEREILRERHGQDLADAKSYLEKANLSFTGRLSYGLL